MYDFLYLFYKSLGKNITNQSENVNKLFKLVKKKCSIKNLAAKQLKIQLYYRKLEPRFQYIWNSTITKMSQFCLDCNIFFLVFIKEINISLLTMTFHFLLWKHFGTNSDSCSMDLLKKSLMKILRKMLSVKIVNSV